LRASLTISNEHGLTVITPKLRPLGRKLSDDVEYLNEELDCSETAYSSESNLNFCSTAEITYKISNSACYHSSELTYIIHNKIIIFSYVQIAKFLSPKRNNFQYKLL